MPGMDNLKPFFKGDPRAVAAGKKSSRTSRARLIKRLKKFDEKAWSTLDKLFDSEDIEMSLEALRIWAKYRLHILTVTPKEEVDDERVPKMSADFAKRLLEVLDS